MEQIICYKICNKDGQYSTGGMRPNWTKRGKVWSSKNGVMGHLAQFLPNTKYYTETDLVVCTTGETLNVLNEIKRLFDARAIKDAKQAAKRKKLCSDCCSCKI